MNKKEEEIFNRIIKEMNKDFKENSSFYHEKERDSYPFEINNEQIYVLIAYLIKIGIIK